MATRPNIVYIHSHDTGRYVQPYGYPVSTPHYQQLADEGVLFRQAFCAAPTCSPSRAALLTGQCAHSSGMLGLAHRGFRLRDYKQHLVHTLNAAGYRTALAGLQHVASRELLPEIDYLEIVGKAETAEYDAAQYLSKQGTGGAPFFLDVGFFETHRKGDFFASIPEGDGRDVRPPAPLPDTPETRADMADFYASAERLDRKVGVVLDALKQYGLEENTLVICTTDHGLAFPRMKCNLTDHGTGVLLILRWPQRFPKGRVVEAMVSHIDLFPTLCDLLEIPHPQWLQGESLLPILNGETEQVHEEVYAEVTFHAAYEPQRSVRTKRWKYICRFDGRTAPVLPNCDDSPSKTLLIGYGWQDHAPDDEQLYDLVFDPNETNNLAMKEEHYATVVEMRERLHAWMDRTYDPLLKGAVKPPPGAVYNDPDGLSPYETPLRAPMPEPPA
jgi:N-sulfoglucosamine sulfohydrolase